MEQTSSSFPQLNAPAPDFDVRTTHGQKKLADYKGKWLILFAHPADFTPVCTFDHLGDLRAHPTWLLIVLWRFSLDWTCLYEPRYGDSVD